MQQFAGVARGVDIFADGVQAWLMLIFYGVQIVY